MRTTDATPQPAAPFVVITGPTACGKTALAVYTAAHLGGEVLSADSRQVYRGMDIGSGKDLGEYTVPYHLIDVAEAGEEYNLFRYQRAFDSAFADIRRRGRVPVLCGGSGLYLAAALGKKQFREVPENTALRVSLQDLSDEALAQKLASYGPLHNHTDTETRTRCLRAIEIAEYERQNPAPPRHLPAAQVFGIRFEPEVLRHRIQIRLDERLQNGMIEEVEGLLRRGLKPEQLIYYGLEYKYITLHLTKHLSREAMARELFFAICQFAKRQRTWFRKMEKEGTPIHWLDGTLSLEEKFEIIIDRISI